MNNDNQPQTTPRPTDLPNQPEPVAGQSPEVNQDQPAPAFPATNPDPTAPEPAPAMDAAIPAQAVDPVAPVAPEAPALAITDSPSVDVPQVETPAMPGADSMTPAPLEQTSVDSVAVNPINESSVAPTGMPQQPLNGEQPDAATPPAMPGVPPETPPVADPTMPGVVGGAPEPVASDDKKKLMMIIGGFGAAVLILVVLVIILILQ